MRGPLIASAITMLIGSAGIMLLTSHSPVIAIVLVSLVFGITSATTTVGNQTALYLAAPPDQMHRLRAVPDVRIPRNHHPAVIGSIVFRDGASDHGLHILASCWSGGLRGPAADRPRPPFVLDRTR